MSDLDKLIEAVEAGNTDRMMMLLHAVPARQWQQSRDAYHGSLDAAKALHEALLPGWHFIIDESMSSVWLKSRGPFEGACKHNPARAWLLAILKAYQTQVNQ